MRLKKFDYKTILLGILGFCTYFILAAYISLPFKIMNIDIKTIPVFIQQIYSLIYNILVLAILMLIFNKGIEKDFKDILNNHKKYFSENIKYWLIGIGIMFFSNYILIFILKNGISDNEILIREAFKESPFILYISSVLIAPIIEELTFRCSLKNIFGRNMIFVLFSGLFFASMHVITVYNSVSDLLYIIPYAGVGLAFSYIYYKTDNIFTTIGFHIMHNGILMTLQFLSLLFLK